MRGLALFAIALLAPLVAQAQPVSNPAPVGDAGAYNAVAPTCTTGQFCFIQVDVNGNLKVVNSGAPSGTQDVNLKQVGGATVDTGHGTAAGAQRVELPTDGTGVVGVSNFPTTVSTGTGAQGASSPRVTVAVDSATVAGSATLPAGTNSIGLVAPNALTTTQVSAAPTATTFAALLAGSASRKGCLVQNTGTTLGYIYFGTTGSATTANTFQLIAGASISCTTPAGVLTDNVAGTCASGTCAFIISSQ